MSKLRVSLLLYTVFMCLRGLYVFAYFVLAVLCVLGIVYEWMQLLLMGGHFDLNFFKKNEQKMKRDP